MGSTASCIKRATAVFDANSPFFVHLCICKSTWESVLENQTPAYYNVQKRPDFLHRSCAEWFHSVFVYNLSHSDNGTLWDNCASTKCPNVVAAISFCIDELWTESRVARCESRLHKFEVKSEESKDGPCVVFSSLFSDVLIKSLSTVLGTPLNARTILAWQQLCNVRLANLVFANQEFTSLSGLSFHHYLLMS